MEGKEAGAGPLPDCEVFELVVPLCEQSPIHFEQLSGEEGGLPPLSRSYWLLFTIQPPPITSSPL
jgi:hypothetical protein